MCVYDIDKILKTSPLSIEEMNQLHKSAGEGNTEAEEALKEALICAGVHVAKYYAEKNQVDFNIFIQNVDIPWLGQCAKYYYSYSLYINDISKYFEEILRTAFILTDEADGAVRIPTVNYKTTVAAWDAMQSDTDAESTAKSTCQMVADKTGISLKETEIILRMEKKKRQKHEQRLREAEERKQYWDSVITDKTLRAFFEDLPERERQVLALRTGLIDGKAYSQEEVAQQLGISVERVGQIERRPFRHVRPRGCVPRKSNSKLRDFLA